MDELPDFHLPLDEKLEWMVETNGYAVEPVPPDPQADPPVAGYTYTINVAELTGFADLVVFGLTPVAASGLLELTIAALRRGTEIPVGVEVVGLLDNDLRCLFGAVDPAVAAALCPSLAVWNGRRPVELVQLIYPDRNGFLPYEPGFAARLRFAQPVVATLAP